MRSTRGRRLARYCEDRIGDHLRVVFGYDQQGYEVHYLGDELAGAYDEADLAAFAATAREVHGDLRESAMERTMTGDQLATVHTFEAAYALQLTIEPDAGVVVSFDKTVGSNLHAFVRACEKRVGE